MTAQTGGISERRGEKRSRWRSRSADRFYLRWSFFHGRGGADQTATPRDGPRQLGVVFDSEKAEAERRYTVFANLKIGSALVALVCIAVAPNASAVTAEVAKKCNALTAKAYPPRVIGNPAAGSAKGTGQSERDYFNKCVANGGNMDDPSSKGAK